MTASERASSGSSKFDTRESDRKLYTVITIIVNLDGTRGTNNQ